MNRLQKFAIGLYLVGAVSPIALVYVREQVFKISEYIQDNARTTAELKLIRKADEVMQVLIRNGRYNKYENEIERNEALKEDYEFLRLAADFEN